MIAAPCAPPRPQPGARPAAQEILHHTRHPYSPIINRAGGLILRGRNLVEGGRA